VKKEQQGDEALSRQRPINPLLKRVKYKRYKQMQSENLKTGFTRPLSNVRLLARAINPLLRTF
jgi:hypothetical protein